MTAKDKITFDAVESAWTWWLSDHPISVPEIIEDAAKKAFDEWLINNSEALIEKLAEKSALYATLKP